MTLGYEACCAREEVRHLLSPHSLQGLESRQYGHRAVLATKQKIILAFFIKELLFPPSISSSRRKGSFKSTI